MNNILINPSISSIFKDFPMPSPNNWNSLEIKAYFEKLLPLSKGDAAFRLNNTGELIELIEGLAVAGKRDIYIWDEMGKMSEMDYLLSARPLPRPILELGCGYGYWISKILRHIDIGIDLFPEKGRYSRSISGIKEKNFIDDTYLTVLRHDVSTPLPIPPASIGTILAICALEHMKNYTAVLAEARKAIKPDGKLILTVDTPLVTEVLDEIYNPAYCKKFKSEHQLETLLTLKEWEDTLDKSGFTLINKTGYINRMQTYLYLAAFYPTDFSSYWTKLGFTGLFKKNKAVRNIWKKEILPCLIKQTNPNESMLLCMTAVPK